MPKSRRERSRLRLLALVLALAVATPVVAQAPAKAPPAGPATPAKPPSSPVAPTPPPVEAEPSVTTAAYGDWVLRCIRPAEAAAPRTCEAILSIVVEGRTAPTAQIVVGRLAPKEPMRVAVLLPNNVALTTPPRVSTGEADPRPLDLVWRRSLPAGCFADAVVPDPTLAVWRAAAEPGRVVFADGAGRPVALPLSFRGLAQALDALARS